MAVPTTPDLTTKIEIFLGNALAGPQLFLKNAAAPLCGSCLGAVYFQRAVKNGVQRKGSRGAWWGMKGLFWGLCNRLIIKGCFWPFLRSLLGKICSLLVFPSSLLRNGRKSRGESREIFLLLDHSAARHLDC